jgi:hypothetical protein
MTLRDFFWLMAGLMTSGAALLVLRTLWRTDIARAATTPRRPILAVAVVMLITAVAVAIYVRNGAPAAIDLRTSTPPLPAAHVSADSLEALTQKLARRLLAEGGKPGEWQLLARSYQELGQPEQARRVLLLARPPMQPTTASAETSTGGGRISGVIDLAIERPPSLPKQATLFVYASEEGVSGPPLAVLRLPASGWPVSFTLDDTHAMLPERTLSGVSRVALEARVSMNGDALARRGDLVGTLHDVDPHATANVRIGIDRTIQ